MFLFDFNASQILLAAGQRNGFPNLCGPLLSQILEGWDRLTDRGCRGGGRGQLRQFLTRGPICPLSHILSNAGQFESLSGHVWPAGRVLKSTDLHVVVNCGALNFNSLFPYYVSNLHAVLSLINCTLVFSYITVILHFLCFLAWLMTRTSSLEYCVHVYF